jgi:hypothetical protein
MCVLTARPTDPRARAGPACARPNVAHTRPGSAPKLGARGMAERSAARMYGRAPRNIVPQRVVNVVV